MVPSFVKTSTACVLGGVITLIVGSSTVHAVTATETVAADAPTATSTANLPDAALNLTISPVTISLETTPGQSVTTPFKIRNNGTETETLQITLGTFTADETGQRPQLRDARPEDTYMAWLSTDQSTFSLAPNEWKTVTLTFTPPNEAALSYYYAVKVSRQPAGSQPGQTVIQGSPALLVLATVTTPNVKKELQLSAFTTGQLIIATLPQSFAYTVTNTGNVHVVPTGTIFIDGEGKKDVAVLPINPGNNTVLPDSERQYTLTWDDPLPENPRTGIMAWLFGQPGPVRWGKYTAHLLLVYDNGERDIPMESYVSFWVIPWQTLLVRFGLPIIPAIGVYLLMQWRLKRQKLKEPRV